GGQSLRTNMEVSPELWNARVTRLMDAGFNFADATTWANLDVRCSTRYLVISAEEYRDAGFCVTDAIAWHMREIDSSTAAGFARGGWQPASFDELHDTLRAALNGLDKYGAMRQVFGALDWAISGISRPLVLLYIRAGVDLSEARKLEARRQAGEPIDDAIRFLAALCEPHHR
ncbi:hypothetical protein, partial [Nocardioides sp. GCM10030258]|uniref:hypothetical protein n=1 Tax=unclassified Nocardioides TaxID=2615069 RepID=UPI00361B2E6A